MTAPCWRGRFAERDADAVALLRALKKKGCHPGVTRTAVQDRFSLFANRRIAMVRSLIAFVLGNFTLTFFVIGLVFSAVTIARTPKPRGAALAIEKLLSWFVFWTIGVLYLYNAVFHIFFGEMAARFIGWADSPFQFEVGTASLGFSALGFLAAFGSFDRRLAAILGSGIFMLGAAGGHVYQMITATTSRRAMPASSSGATSCCRRSALRCCGSTGTRRP
jgi:hypothetical protein